MRIRITSLLALMLCLLTVSAATLTPDEALNRIFANGSNKAPSLNSDALQLCYTVIEMETPAVYVFNRGEDSGFLLVGADECSRPLLGYSDSGRFDLNEIPPAMKWWLSEYARLVAYANALGIEVPQNGVSVTGKAIEPMIKTYWNQGEPFNNLCPADNGKKCMTGCVATALAQVMYYHRYPSVGKGTGNAKMNNKAISSIDFADYTLDWDNMIPLYTKGNYSTTQANAVATLMKVCGYAVNMNYGTSESGASSFNVGSGLINYFSYNPNIRYEQRDYFETNEWNQMVYNELAASRPVLYSGHGDGGGHEFVCDGYDGKGYFHINWGWGGTSDGYFLLESLNPSDLGIGGGTGGGFSFIQTIMRGVQVEPVKVSNSLNFLQQGQIDCTVSGQTVTIKPKNGGFFNWGYSPINMSLGVKIEPSSGGTPIYLTYTTNSNLKSFNGYSSVNFNFPSDLSNGNYKVTVVVKDNSKPTPSWEPVPAELTTSNYICISKNSSGLIPDIPAAKTLTIKSASLKSALYYKNNTKIELEVENNTDTQLTQIIEPILSKDGTTWFKATGMLFTLNPGECVKKEFVTYFNPSSNNPVVGNMEFDLSFINQWTKATYPVNGVNAQKVTMGIAQEGKLTLSNFKLKDSAKNGNFWIVTNPRSFTLNVDAICTGGFFGRSLMAYLFPYIPGQQVYSIMGVEMTPGLTLSSGESCTLSANFPFAQATDGNKYFIQIHDGNGWLSGELDFIVQDSGVNDIQSECSTIKYEKSSGLITADGLIRVISIEGKLLKEGTNTVDISGLKGMVIAVSEKDSLKLAL